MKCKHVVEQLVALVKNEVEEAAVGEIQEHLKSCESCGQEERAVRKTLGLADRGSQVMPSNESWNKLKSEMTSMPQRPKETPLPMWVWLVVVIRR